MQWAAIEVTLSVRLSALFVSKFDCMYTIFLSSSDLAGNLTAKNDILLNIHIPESRELPTVWIQCQAHFYKVDYLENIDEHENKKASFLHKKRFNF